MTDDGEVTWRANGGAPELAAQNLPTQYGRQSARPVLKLFQVPSRVRKIKWGTKARGRRVNTLCT